jgi:hypothetical protein
MIKDLRIKDMHISLRHPLAELEDGDKHSGEWDGEV